MEKEKISYLFSRATFKDVSSSVEEIYPSE